MSDRSWLNAYGDRYRSASKTLLGIRRTSERVSACVKVLIDASASLTSLVPSAISAPSPDRAIELAEIAGTAIAVKAVLDCVVNNRRRIGELDLSQLEERSSSWPGQFASRLMAASDGDMEMLLYKSAAPTLKAGWLDGRPASWFESPASHIELAGVFLAELNANARVRSAATQVACAEALNQQIARTRPAPSADITAHAFAVHHLTGIHGTGDKVLYGVMLRFVASYPPHEGATLQASRVAALLYDGQGARARMSLLDEFLIGLGPRFGEKPEVASYVSELALVLMLYDTYATEPDELTDSATSLAPPGTPGAPEADHGPRPTTGSQRPHAADTPSIDAIAEIAREAEQATAAATAKRQARYETAVAANSLADALTVVRESAADDDYERAWLLFQDTARRFPEADPRDLVTVAPNVLGPVPLDSKECFDAPGAGRFTLLSPTVHEAAAAIARVAPRLMNVDERGIEHADSETARTAGLYTPNYLHDLASCDRAVQVSLDTKGTMSAPMARTMLAILTQALVEDRVAALVCGWIPAFDPLMTRWNAED